MDKAQLLALADRVEALTGPCFDVEDAIEKAVRQPWRFPPPNYTASLDAAMTLVPEGMDVWGLKNLIDRAVYDAIGPHDTGKSLIEKLPRFIVAASLRAMAGGDDEN